MKKSKSKVEKGLKSALQEALRQKRLADVYRTAANLVEQKEFACWAISSTLRRPPNREVSQHKTFHGIYRPPDSSFSAYFSFDENGISDPEYRSATSLGKLSRAIALDLLAILVEENNKVLGGLNG
jgi:hypothetical protein